MQSKKDQSGSCVLEAEMSLLGGYLRTLFDRSKVSSVQSVVVNVASAKSVALKRLTDSIPRGQLQARKPNGGGVGGGKVTDVRTKEQTDW